MKTLSESDLEYVGGGDSWAGTAEGRAPYSRLDAIQACVNDSVLAGNTDPLDVGLGCIMREGVT